MADVVLPWRGAAQDRGAEAPSPLSRRPAPAGAHRSWLAHLGHTLPGGARQTPGAALRIRFGRW